LITMARRTISGLFAAAMLLGLVALVPMVADAGGGAAAGTGTPAVASPTLAATDVPLDPQPLVLLLVAGSIGAMGVLSREPVAERSRARR
jgi:hypothetical protein